MLSYTAKPVIWGTLAAYQAGVKNIYSIITGLGYAFTDITGLKHWGIHKLVTILYRRSLHYNKAIFFQNTDDLCLFQQLKIINSVQKTVVLNGSGVDLDYYIASEPAISPLRFLMIGRLLKDKGIHEYLHAAKYIKSRHPETEFHLAGWIDDNPTAITLTTLQEFIDKKNCFSWKSK